MRINPRYGTNPVITLDGPPGAIRGPTIRQRRRLAKSLESLSDEQWAHPSRCEGWSTRDVIVHLDSTNAFWTYSVTAGLRGDPTKLLADFDPVASPAELVAASKGVEPREVLDRFLSSNDALETVLSSVDDDSWTMPAEAPPGHLAISAVAHHALWDAWIHERDILLPLGIDAPRESDEIAASLRYVAALAPALALTQGTGDAGTWNIEASDPDVTAVVEISDHVSVSNGDSAGTEVVRLSGDAVELLEALSLRCPLPPSVPLEARQLLSGLAQTFDVIPGASERDA